MSFYSVEQKYLAIGKESVRGTAATPTRYIPVGTDSELEYKLNHLEDEQLRGLLERFPPQAGTKDGNGKISNMDMTSDNCGEFFYSLLGSVSSAETASITIDATNNKLDFNIGATQLTATIASLTYPIGLVQTDAGTLCKAIYDAIHSAEAVGTYTVTYSRTTNKFTITRSAGTFNILWNTGTNTAVSIASTIGFSTAADSTGSLTYTSANTVNFAMTHTFTNGSLIQNPSYTLHMERALSKKMYNLSVVKTIGLKGAVDGKLTGDISTIFQTEAAETFTLTPVWVNPTPFMFYQTTFAFDAVNNLADIKDWTLNIDNLSMPQRVLSNSQDIKDVLTPGKMTTNGTFNAYFESEAQRTKFLANTAVALTITLQGNAIGAAFNKMVITLPEIHYKAYPFGNLDGLLGAAVSWDAYYNISGAKSVSVALTNGVTSY